MTGDPEALRLAFSWTSLDDLTAGGERVVAACARVAGG